MTPASLPDRSPASAARPIGLACLAVCAAAILPYLTTLNDYFVRDDFGVVQLLAQKPAFYFPRWFVSSWMDFIWGYVPDEVRPFTAVTYQLTALGGAASPTLHHVLNVLIHAANGLLVLAIARSAASLRLPAATFAAVVFVLLPVHAESVAWITGRVDSMPTLFYLASFLAFVYWRTSESAAWRWYLTSLALFFVALFTKQNTITMVATLVGYDVIVRRRALRPLMAFALPYVPFVVMTAGYLWLRYRLFGQVAREGTLDAQFVENFRWLFMRHVTHVVIGILDGPVLPVWIALALLIGVSVWTLRRARSTAADDRATVDGLLRAMLYFGPVWWLIGVAPVAVAGYSSPRHVYLAAVGWALALGVALEMLWTTRPSPGRRRAVLGIAAVAVAVYVVGLGVTVREWNVTAAVSHQATRDMRSVALAAPQGSLIIVGAPSRSWDWALPFSVRPPFQRTDLTERVFVISPRPLSCCPSQWFDETRQALTAWSAGAGRNSAVALRWNPETGALAKASDREVPDLPVLSRGLLDIAKPDELSRNLARILEVLPR